MPIKTYFNTIKYLRCSQIYYRILKHFIRPVPHTLTGENRTSTGRWLTFSLYTQKIFPDNRVEFLNQEGFVNTPNDWNDESKGKLWLYNLHYFDDLCAENSEGRCDQQRSLIKRWISENPAPFGNGWEPYTSSLRIVNWIKFFLSGQQPDQELLDNLAQQTDYLSQNLERHLLGNHLFSNAKALIFSGLYLQGDDADQWFKAGLKIYSNEIREQILTDGGNFELSPMYHSIMLVDILDLINLFTAYPNSIDADIFNHTRLTAVKMIDWLQIMTHDDNEISFFNDSAQCIAASPQKIYSYAKLLGLKLPKTRTEKLIQLKASGYSRINSPMHTLYFDHAMVGPDYQPAHAHADSLSIEWSIGQQRVLVNSGTSMYGLSNERLKQRKTAAHNTVVVNGEDSSEVWSGFRVARRAYTTVLKTQETTDSIKISASHNGYNRLNGKITHTRTVDSEIHKLSLTDKLTGHWQSAIAFFHLHPDIEVTDISKDSAQLLLQNGKIIEISTTGTLSISEGFWHPEFGRSIPNQCLSISFSTATLKTTFELDGEET